MKNTIYCKTTSKATHSFYLKSEGNEYFLFSQDYRKGVNDYYKGGVSLDRAADFTKSKFDSAVMLTMSKIFMYIKYIEKEYGIQVLKQTIKKNNKYNKSRLYA